MRPGQVGPRKLVENATRKKDYALCKLLVYGVASIF